MSGPTASGQQLRGVIIDWGGVLTTSIKDMIALWLAADGIEADGYRTLMRGWSRQAYSGGPANPIHRLERGDGDPAEFERDLAARLVRTDGAPVPADGLLRRMFARAQPEPAMYDLLRTLRAAGVRTCLLSNSWGNDLYPREKFPDLFDAWVISCEVGMRKPDPEIFHHAAGLLALPPAQCVFIDDMQPNVDAATALGMTALRHRDPATTTAELTTLLGLPPGALS